MIYKYIRKSRYCFNVQVLGAFLLFVPVLLIDSVTLFAQENSSLSIGTDQPKDNAVLLLHSPNHDQGLVIPISDRKKINAPQQGMVVFDQNDHSVFYHDGTKWILLGSSNSTPANLKIEVLGNTIRLMDGSTLIHSTSLASGVPVTNQVLSWNGSAWTASSLTGDVDRSSASIKVTGLLGKNLPALPNVTQALVYNGSAWVFQTLSSITSVSANSPITITNGTTTPKISIGQSGKLQDGYLSSIDWNMFNDKLSLGSLAGGDLSGTFPNPMVSGLYGHKLSSTIPIDGQVLKWNQSNSEWAPQNEAVNNNSIPVLNDNQLLVGDGTNNYVKTLNGDAIINSVNGNVTVQGLLGRTLNAVPPTDGQVLKWNQSSNFWEAQIDDNGMGGAASGDLSGAYPNPLVTGLQGMPVAAGLPNDQQVLKWSGANNEWEAQDESAGGFASGDLSGTYPSPTVIALQGWPVNADPPMNGQVLKWDQANTRWSPQPDNVGAGTVATLNAGEILLGDGTSNFAQTLSGDAKINSVTGILTVANNAITSTKIQDDAVITSKIPDNAVTDAKINSVSATKVAGIGISYIPRGSALGLVNSQIRDDGSGIGFGAAPSPTSKLFLLNLSRNNGFFLANTFASSSDITGIYSSTSGSSASNIGIRGTANNATGIAYGVQGFGVGTLGGTGNCYGVYGIATNSGTNYGFYGETSGGGIKNYAGYFKTYAGLNTVLATGLSSEILAASDNAGNLIGLNITIDKDVSQQGSNHLIKAGYIQPPLANLSSPLFNRYGFYITNEQYNYLSGRLSIGSTNDGYGNLQVKQGPDPATDGLWLTDGTGTYSFWIEPASQYLTLRKNGIGMLGGFNNTTGVYTNISDRRRKKNIKGMDSVLQEVLKLKPSTYLMNDQSAGEELNLGFIAQEVKEIFPSLVKYHVKEDLYSLDYSGFSTIAIKAIQEQQTLIQEQAATINQLTKQIQQTMEKLSEIDLLKDEVSNIRKILMKETSTIINTDGK